MSKAKRVEDAERAVERATTAIKEDLRLNGSALTHGLMAALEELRLARIAEAARKLEGGK